MSRAKLDKKTAARIGDNIRKLRESKSMSINQLAHDLNTYYGSIHRIEAGQGLSVAFLIKISDYFKVSMDQIVKGLKK